MNRWLRLFAPAVALAVVLVTAFAALGGGRASAGQLQVTGQPAGDLVAAPIAAQAAKLAAVAARPAAAVAAQPPVPTEEPTTGPNTDKVEQQDEQQGDAQDETEDEPQSGVQDEAQDGAETPDNEAADGTALASKAKITADQAKAVALAANPGASAVKVELGDENGTIVYSVELSTGADVKVDAQSGKIVTTDQPDSERQDGTD